MGSQELEMTLHERTAMIEAVEQSQMQQLATLGSHFMDMLSIDGSDASYQSFRSKTRFGLEVGSLVAGGYGAIKGVIAFNRLARAPQQVAKIVKLNAKTLKSGNGFFGNKGFELKNATYQKIRNNPTTIQGRSYGGHALDQMQNRGFTPSIVEETIQSGFRMPNKVPGRIQFYDPINNISVITEDSKVNMI
jgi:hypothetical protein